jgi:NAD+ synthase (glutamine-hydrolysing)
VKIFIGQLNPTVGALDANRDLILDAYRRGIEAGADLVVTPELGVTGYPPKDLLERPRFVEEALRVRDELVGHTGETALVFGCVAHNSDPCGKPLHNVAVVAQKGRILLEQKKSLLPTYDVFDELRHFEPAKSVSAITLFGRKVGVSICEDFWYEDVIGGREIYCDNPVDDLARAGCDVLVNISASPFNTGKKESRYRLFRDIARQFSIPIVYVNQVGGNDELLFDGSSIVINRNGDTVFCARSFEPDYALVPLDGPPCESVFSMGQAEEITRALMLGLGDYLRKCGFSNVVIGLSGGIDSAVTAALAAQTIGADHVTGIAMPSPFSSQGSIDDARALAENLGIAFHVVPIADTYGQYERMLETLFGESKFDVTNENVQARIRGNILMAWSNRRGAMVLSTGNKSEMAVGYCTLYGDMAGGLSLLGDVYKTSVYAVAQWINREREIIPVSTMTKPPSAELRPGQTDQDSLPPYETLDAILKLYLEERMELEEIAAAGYDRSLVARILWMVDAAEFKRQQAAPTIRVSPKAFGGGRQIPIAQRWRQTIGSRSSGPQAVKSSGDDDSTT